MAFRSLSSWSAQGTVAAGLLLFGCDNDYPIAPTACDDWCYATQRADCEEDGEPDECVSDCEATSLGRQHPECEPEWVTLTECYREAPDSSFTCVNDYSEPLNSLCLEERRTANYCVSERNGVCFDQCIRKAEACGGGLGNCEWECTQATEGCETEELELHRCLLQEPVICRAEGSPELPDDLQCCEEFVAFLECDGSASPSCEELANPDG